MLNIYNLSQDFMSYLNCINDTALDLKKCWTEVCYSKYPNVYDYVEELYSQINTSTELHKAVFDHVTKEEIVKKIISISERLDKHLNEIKSKFIQNNLSDIDEIDFNIYILVGNASTNAIVTPFNNGSLFLFTEYLAEGEYFDMLLAHEFLHIVHRQSNSGQYDDVTLVDLLFSEGIACSASKLIKPGYSANEYIECGVVKKAPERMKFIKENQKMILEDLDNNNQEVFSNYLSYGDFDLHRIGYDIGYHTVQEMLKRRSMRQLLDLNIKKVRVEFKHALELILKEIG